MELKKILRPHILVLFILISGVTIAYAATVTVDIISPPILDSLKAIDDKTIELTWTEPVDTKLILQYNIYKDSGSGFTFLTKAGLGTISYLDTGLSPGTYTYFITSLGASNESPPSDLLSINLGVSTPIGEPPILIALIPTDTTVDLMLIEPSNTKDITQYNIYRDSVLVNKVPVGTKQFTDSGLTLATSYKYYVTSTGSFGESLPSNVLGTTTKGLGLGEPPEIIGIKSDGIDQLIVVWEEPKDTSMIDSYNIERISDKEIDFSLIGSVTVGTITFNDVKLATSVKYTYRIFSIDNQGNPSLPSNEFTAVVNIDQTDLTAKGQVLEPNPTNNFNKEQKEILAQTIEMFGVDKDIMALIIDDVENTKLNAYEVINKMLDGSYGSSDELKTAGAFYGQFYIDNNDLTQFLTDIQNKARIVNGGSDGKGDNPNVGVPQIGH